MKSTAITPVTGENWFVNNIYRAAGYVTTVTAFILAALKKNTALTQAYFIDRNPEDLDSNATIVIGEMGFVSPETMENSVTIVELIGERDPETRTITFGVGGVTPNTVKATLAAAINGLNLQNQVDAGYNAKDGVMDLVKALVSPRVAETSLREALNFAFDLIPVLRVGMDASKRLVVSFNQETNSGGIKIIELSVSSLPAINGEIFQGTCKAPELPSVNQASTRDFGE